MARRNHNIKYELQDYDDYGDYDDETKEQEQEQDPELKKAIEASKAQFNKEQPKSKSQFYLSFVRAG
jgi:hypothetical protein